MIRQFVRMLVISHNLALNALTHYPPNTEAHVWRQIRTIAGRLRCGLVISGSRIERWAAATLDLLNATPEIRIEAVYCLDHPGSHDRSPGGVLFRRLQAWSNLSAAPLERIDLKTPAGTSKEVLRTSSGHVLPEDADAIRNKSLDLLIWLESRPLPVDCSALARHGVWSVCCGDPAMPLSTPPYWSEVRDNQPVSAVTIQQQLPEATRIVARGVAATEPGMRFTANAATPLELAGHLLLRRLTELMGNPRLTEDCPPSPRPLAQASPGNLSTGVFLARQACHSVSIRLSAKTHRWFIALRDRNRMSDRDVPRFSAEGFREVPMPAGYNYADPFLVEDAGRHWLFYEEFSDARKGTLACREIRDNSEPGEQMTVLDLPYHLSYPEVFRDRGEYFMLPETCDNNRVELYRARRFPDEWKLEAVLYPGVTVVDTTVFTLDGTWYFFTSSGYGGTESFLFWSDRLDGKWNYHPANPISSDVRSGRGAGNLFYRGEVLIRPTQDCSVHYGYGMTWNRVKRLSRSEFEEETLQHIAPTWRRGLIKTHTFNTTSRYDVIDGAYYK